MLFVSESLVECWISIIYLRDLFGWRPPRHIIVQFIIAFVTLIAVLVAGHTKRWWREHIRHGQNWRTSTSCATWYTIWIFVLCQMIITHAGLLRIPRRWFNMSGLSKFGLFEPPGISRWLPTVNIEWAVNGAVAGVVGLLTLYSVVMQVGPVAPPAKPAAVAAAVVVVVVVVVVVCFRFVFESDVTTDCKWSEAANEMASNGLLGWALLSVDVCGIWW